MTTKSSGILSKVETEVVETPQTGFIYGGPGCGKTKFLLTAQEILNPSLIVTVEGNDPTIRRFNQGCHILNLAKLVRSENKSFTSLMEELVSSLEKKNPYKFVGFDGVSKLINPIMYRDVLKQENKSGPTSDIPDEYTYKVTNLRIFSWFERLKSAALHHGFHLVLTAREDSETLEVEGQQTDQSFFYPAMSASLRRLMLHEYDFCIRLVIKRARAEAPTAVAQTVSKPGLAAKPRPTLSFVRYANVHPSQSMLIKNKYEDKFPKAEIPNFTMAEFFKYVYGPKGCTLSGVSIKKEGEEELGQTKSEDSKEEGNSGGAVLLQDSEGRGEGNQGEGEP